MGLQPPLASPRISSATTFAAVQRPILREQTGVGPVRSAQIGKFSIMLVTLVLSHRVLISPLLPGFLFCRIHSASQYLSGAEPDDFGCGRAHHGDDGNSPNKIADWPCQSNREGACCEAPVVPSPSSTVTPTRTATSTETATHTRSAVSRQDYQVVLLIVKRCQLVTLLLFSL
jgi:hypothetical protein